MSLLLRSVLPLLGFVAGVVGMSGAPRLWPWGRTETIIGSIVTLACLLGFLTAMDAGDRQRGRAAALFILGDGAVVLLVAILSWTLLAPNYSVTNRAELTVSGCLFVFVGIAGLVWPGLKGGRTRD